LVSFAGDEGEEALWLLPKASSPVTKQTSPSNRTSFHDVQELKEKKRWGRLQKAQHAFTNNIP
jgi:hypothetical protein